MSRIATNVVSSVQPRLGSQLWFSSPTPRCCNTIAALLIGSAASRPRPAMRDGPGSTSGTALTASAGEVVGHDELAQRAALGLEHPSAVAAPDFLHERDQSRVVVEHEHVDRRATPG